MFNPGPTTQEVTVRARLGSGALSPFHARVSPDTTGSCSTGDQTRIPKGDPYSAVIEANAGAGVVVGRFVAAPSSSPVPQDGMAMAVGALTATARSHQWVVPSPGSATNPATPGAAPAHLAVTNVAGHRETFVVQVLLPHGLRTLASGSYSGLEVLFIAYGDTGAGRTQSAARHGQRSQRPSARMSAPSGNYGVVTMPGIPLASPLASPSPSRSK